jgi:hypothetical protein
VERAVVRGHRAPGEADSCSEELAALVEHRDAIQIGTFGALAAQGSIEPPVAGDAFESMRASILEHEA